MKKMRFGVRKLALIALPSISVLSLTNLGRKARLLTILASALVLPVMAETTSGIVYKVRFANGIDQYYQIVAPTNVPPPKAVKWVTPSVASNKISAQSAGIAAVAWAGGLSTRVKGGPPNSMVNVGGSQPGGFYNAANVRIDSVQLQNGPLPYYLVRMTGEVGQDRQILYAAVLEDGRIIRPTLVSGASPPTQSKVRHHSRISSRT
jgi:hypothetical protein